MLDAKRTFDDLIELLAPDASTREEILANRIYQELSSAVAGSQEFTAVAKLYELDASGRFDAIVLDTPPSRNALELPRRPPAADRIPRRSGAEGPHRTDRRGRQDRSTGQRRRLLRPAACDGRRPTRRPQRVLPRTQRRRRRVR
jgi:anion-transporting  ArsA/GET3 family ATPase